MFAKSLLLIEKERKGCFNAGYQLIFTGKSTSIVFHTPTPITYGQLQNEFTVYRNFFYDRGIRKGENVGLFSKNSAEFVYCYMALTSLGAIVVPFNFQLTTRKLLLL